MKASFSRRDFLRAAGLVPVGVGLAPLLSGARVLPQAAGAAQNVLVLVFDGCLFSARCLLVFLREEDSHSRP